MLLIGSPRFMAMPARQNAAATDTTPHRRRPRTLFIRTSLLEWPETAQKGIGGAAVRELHRMHRIPVVVERADVQRALAVRAHQDDGVGAVRIRECAVLDRAGFRLPVV